MKAPTGSFIMVEPDLVAQVGVAAAVLYARIAWRSDRAGWRASRSTLRAETGLTEWQVREAVKVLREQGLVTAERQSVEDSTLVWTAHRPMEDSAPPYGGFGHLPDVEESSMSSLETVVDLETPDAVASEPTTPEVPMTEPLPPSEQMTLLPMAVPEPGVEPVQSGPPQTAQTLVARWCDGYRAANGGVDAPGPVMKRVAGQARNMAKGCASDADWNAAWRAAYAAGQHGRPDAVPFLVTVRSMYPATGRVNHDLANLRADREAAPGTALAMAMLNAPARTRP